MNALTKRGTPRKRPYPDRRAKRGASALERIQLHIKINAAGCWVWTAWRSSEGYGRVTIDGIPQYAHRVAYEAVVGPIPSGLHIDHLCRNRACCNPRHLEPVTPLTNTLRGEGNPSKTHCPRQHPYDDENTYRHNGRRYCRTCRRRQMAEFKERQAGLPRAAADSP